MAEVAVEEIENVFSGHSETDNHTQDKNKKQKKKKNQEHFIF